MSNRYATIEKENAKIILKDCTMDTLKILCNLKERIGFIPDVCLKYVGKVSEEFCTIVEMCIDDTKDTVLGPMLLNKVCSYIDTRSQYNELNKYIVNTYLGDYDIDVFELFKNANKSIYSYHIDVAISIIKDLQNGRIPTEILKDISNDIIHDQYVFLVDVYNMYKINLFEDYGYDIFTKDFEKFKENVMKEIEKDNLINSLLD